MTDYILNFQDGDTGEHIATISGKRAKYLMDHSDFLKTLIEINSSERTFTIPVHFPHGRAEIFKKILRGYPVGRYIRATGGEKEIQWNPLSNEEEALIAKGLKNGSIRSTLQKERESVILEVLRYLMLDSDAEMEYLKIENLNNESKELVRRRNITQRRYQGKANQILAYNQYNEGQYNNAMRNAERTTIPYLNEDKIENLVEKHKNYLYGLYAPTRRNKLSAVLNKKNIQTRNKNQAAREKGRKKQMQELKRHRKNNNNTYNNYRNYENNHTRNPYEGGPYNTNYLEEVNLAPFMNKDIAKMTNPEFERYVRSLRREGQEKNLPYQGALVGNLFGNQTTV